MAQVSQIAGIYHLSHQGRSLVWNNEFIHLIYIVKFIGIKLSLVSAYYPFNVSKICGNVSSHSCHSDEK